MKRKTKEMSIKHIVNDGFTGIYFETDILERTITVGRGLRKRRFSLGEAAQFEFLFKRQIDRLLGNYPKETDSDKAEVLICPNCGKTEKSTADFCGNCGCKLSSAKKE